MHNSSRYLLYGQIGAAALVLIAMGFGSIPTLAGSVIIFGVIGLFGLWQKPRLLGVARYYLYLAVFSVVVVMTSTFFPFIGGKDYFFRFSVELALIFFVLWWAFESRDGEVEALVKDVYKKPVFIAVSLFVFVFLLSSIFAYDPHAAFWSNYERGEGGFEMLHYYVFFVLLVLLLKKENDWRAIFKVSLVAAGLLVLYGVFAQLGWANSFISPFQGGTAPSGWLSKIVSPNLRIQGSLGNPAYVAPYLMFAMFYAAYLWATSAKRRKTLVMIGWIALVAALFFFFMLSQTRGAFLGFIVAILTFLIYLGFAMPKFRPFSLGILAFLLIAGSVLVRYRNSVFVQNLPGGRMFDMPLGGFSLVALSLYVMFTAVLIAFARQRKYLWWVLLGFQVLAVVLGAYMVGSGRVNLTDPTTSTRFWTWGSAWRGFLERPVLGWGAENFSSVFDKYFNPRHYIPGTSSETWFDRAHSIYFDYLSETGILGLLSYLSIFAAVFWGALRKNGAEAVNAVRQAESSPTKHSPIVRALMISLPIGYLVQGVAIFDVLPMYVNLFLFFAFGYYYLYLHNNESYA